MSRQEVRDLKRAVRSGVADRGCQQLARESALTLLKRSITFGHVRLAVIRLGVAVSMGAEVAADQWNYCRRAAETSRDQAVQDMFRVTVQRADAQGMNPMGNRPLPDATRTSDDATLAP